MGRNSDFHYVFSLIFAVFPLLVLRCRGDTRRTFLRLRSSPVRERSFFDTSSLLPINQQSFQEELPSQQSKNPTMRASAVATLFSLAAGASAFTVGGPAIVSRPVSFCVDGSRFLLPKIQNHHSVF